jgi:hypothetical protein
VTAENESVIHCEAHGSATTHLSLAPAHVTTSNASSLITDDYPQSSSEEVMPRLDINFQ